MPIISKCVYRGENTRKKRVREGQRGTKSEMSESRRERKVNGKDEGSGLGPFPWMLSPTTHALIVTALTNSGWLCPNPGILSDSTELP